MAKDFDETIIELEDARDALEKALQVVTSSLRFIRASSKLDFASEYKRRFERQVERNKEIRVMNVEQTKLLKHLERRDHEIDETLSELQKGLNSIEVRINQPDND